MGGVVDGDKVMGGGDFGKEGGFGFEGGMMVNVLGVELGEMGIRVKNRVREDGGEMLEVNGGRIEWGVKGLGDLVNMVGSDERGVRGVRVKGDRKEF